jgi:hypothetical protein
MSLAVMGNQRGRTHWKLDSAQEELRIVNLGLCARSISKERGQARFPNPKLIKVEL